MSDNEAIVTQILTPEQVENWRRVLSAMIGPYAWVMPVAEVQKIRDRLQQFAANPTTTEHRP